ncbi:metallophosphoesterase family protein [Saccharothrix coeruleofusca]|uniref:Metallophosphoesterase n=1 Tax=Saccharothrix coeruleofusca TaxID=33919 RepID=A0A918AIK7_9PSEU|nr:metallophosphoesterase [Saccharothrix coeruleofusca]MBP2334406.1 Icc-related predicted phosphoesterase [Saccharothrix coeruleofusca]GGP41288.1 metallophosphoesterase [Saccharothrix coeruleofusca]
MRVHVVSDVHGNAEALARAGDGADALVVLGDLVDFVDYHDHGGGILGRVFGAEKVEVFARLRRGRMGEASHYIRSLWAGLDNAAEVVREAVLEQYTELFAAMSAPTYATPGNVDNPELWPLFAREGLHMLDGETAEIGGLRFGFAGGAILASGYVRRRGGPWHPYLRTEEEFGAALAGLGEVDVLCTHVPPAVAELTYDVVARRAELGSTSLLKVIERDRPRWSVFGHVHQPMARRVRIGWTECVNVGHFQRRGTPHVLRW